MLAVEILSECAEALAKECGELVGPVHDIPQRFGVQPVQPVATVAAYRGSPGDDPVDLQTTFKVTG